MQCIGFLPIAIVHLSACVYVFKYLCHVGGPRENNLRQISKIVFTESVTIMFLNGILRMN